MISVIEFLADQQNAPSSGLQQLVLTILVRQLAAIRTNLLLITMLTGARHWILS